MARYIDHAGYTVPDLDQALAFFTEVLGCELLYQAGSYQDPTSDYMTTRLDVDRRASVRLAVLRWGPVNNIELVQFASPEQNTVPPKVSDVGGRHLAIYVDDMDRAVSYLKKQSGVRVLEPHNVGEVGKSEEGGVQARYFVTPWSMYMELINRPEKMLYENRTSARLFRLNVVWESQ
jgi:catechol 2,3-dioxygenase-like lactoylglutathione lyase family enzyme